ncbi:MAG: EpsG family protein [Bacteroidota bacterium]
MSYIILLLFIIVLLLIGVVSNKNRILFLIFLVLSLFSGFRYDVGTDYMSYSKTFDYLESYNPFIELGFTYLLYFVKYIGGTQQLVFLIFAICTQFLFIKFIKTYSRFPLISTLTYICIGPFFLASLSGIRQYLAISIFLYSLKFIIEKKIIKYLLVIFFAAFFSHFSILLLIPFYFLLSEEISFKKKCVFIAITLVGSWLLSAIISMTIYSRFLEVESKGYTINFTVYVFIIISIIILFFEKKNTDSKLTIFYNMNFFSLLCMIVMLLNSGLTADIFLRTNNYFMVSYIVLIPSLVLQFKEVDTKMVFYTLYITVLLAYFYRNTMINGFEGHLLPYSTNFNLFI